MENRRIDLRVRKTLEAIRSTFKKMVCEMDVSKITVKELAQRARIHRKPFICTIPRLKRCLRICCRNLPISTFAEIDQVPIPMHMKDVNRAFFAALSRQDAFVEHLICAESYRGFCNKLFAAALRHNRTRYNPYAHLPQEEQNIVNTFTTQSSLDMYRQWVADGKTINCVQDNGNATDSLYIYYLFVWGFGYSFL